MHLIVWLLGFGLLVSGLCLSIYLGFGLSALKLCICRFDVVNDVAIGVCLPVVWCYLD